MKYLMIVLGLVGGLVFTEAANAKAASTEIKILRTPKGIRFGLLGSKGTSPAPTLFVFASAIQDSLKNADYNQIALVLAKHGYLAVSLDVPSHGADVKNKEDIGLVGWRKRLDQGDPFVQGFVSRASAVLDYLIKESYTDPKRVAACGTSRGGFLALHFAAAEPRVKCAAAFAPVTNLLALTEFAGMQKHAATKKLDLINSTDKLAGRALWLCIGNNDLRVSTDDVIGFCRGVVKSSTAQKKPANVELHVMPVIGHTIHDTAHAEAAAWILKEMKMK